MRRVIGILFLILLGCKVSAQLSTVNHWESVVYANDTWQYFVGDTIGPPVGWQLSTFNAASWNTGKGGIGYSDGDDSTDLSPDTIHPSPPINSVFIRIQFNITDTSDIALAMLNADYDDGFVAWLNGEEIARAGLGSTGDHPDYNTGAVDHEAAMYRGLAPEAYTISKAKLRSCFVNGTNCLAVQVNNSNPSSSDLSAIFFLSLGIKSAAVHYRQVPSWFVPPADQTALHLPLVVIYTHGSYINQNQKVMVDLGIIDNGPGKTNSLLDPRNVYDGKAGIEIRGSSSTMFPKKNYGLELWAGINIDTAYSLLGMPPESDWVLHGPYSDKSLIRNFMAYHLAADMGHYAPRTRMCELYIDDQYQGFYILLEKIKRDKNRVAIAKLTAADLSGNDLTGGYIVKIDRSATDYTDGWFSPYDGNGTGDPRKIFFAYHYPKWQDIKPNQKAYIQSHITTFEHVLHGSTYRDPASGYRKYIDVNSFIDYFLLVELSKNTDGYRLSTFLHKDRDDRDPRIYMGPVWDYDLAFGNADYLDAFNTSGWNYSIPADGWGNPFWWSKLLTDPYYVNALHCRWNDLRQGILSNDALMAFIDASVDSIGYASDRNFDQWPIHGMYVWPNPYYGNTYTEDITYMKNWIRDRANWMDANMPGTCITDIENPDASAGLILKAYPNPAIGEVNLEIENPYTNSLQMEVYNLTGQLVYISALKKEALLTERLSLKPGVYMVRVSGGVETRTIKVVIQ